MMGKPAKPQMFERVMKPLLAELERVERGEGRVFIGFYDDSDPHGDIRCPRCGGTAHVENIWGPEGPHGRVLLWTGWHCGNCGSYFGGA